jgi:thioredoxin-dependent peroxiredoxin
MSTIHFKGNPVHTSGTLPAKGEKAPDFVLTRTDLSDFSLKDLKGKKILLNIFPSLDTSVCATSVRKFNQEAANLKDVMVLAISKDLPFAHNRFCTAEGIDRVVSSSVLRNDSFGKNFGVLMIDGPLAGLLSRAVVVLDQDGKVLYSEQVPEITQEPDYKAALSLLS